LVFERSFGVSSIKTWKIESKFLVTHLLRLLCFRKPRYFSGLLSAALGGFLTFTFLEPLFTPVGLDLANVALWVLALYASMVGMGLGVLLPTLCPGLCFGTTIALLVGCFTGISTSLYFPVVGGICAVIGAILSIR
jgi:callose synthase